MKRFIKAKSYFPVNSGQYMYELTLDGLVHLVPELIEPAPPGLPLWDHVLGVDHASTIYSTPVRAKQKIYLEFLQCCGSCK